MAARNAFRYVSRRLSSSGKVLGEEERAAENVYIKKVEKEKLEKLARKGPNSEQAATSSGGSGSVTDATASAQTSSTPGVSDDKYRNYAVVAGLVTGVGALGWYLLSKDKAEEVQD
ncbi:uncharacterized protein At2g27730, mitochondrial-like isoform X1 [Nicotiana tomentosiformis]|uniref:Uncharacterized protein At2g27730, mitochondrial n=1 Tax=Nicotiana tabacum TaxID=4097 RepID=A0A1S4BDC5_TOBAC|nr:uncharacterized protein At2g27730, mitochondrial-like [Nicotiana tomentosiformis]XP_016486898.1 PREDICTED: uncharacterized protein At2g27730, mitochondrial-like [Nicotiana tabacum]XP_016486899.1 PREDICTED: uncharacterized protein At2g27730, mitochondrial-like [Nicotiana tabacum]XP_033510813.1 uncharacterized protein At2g27730, mitochondrial-like [Nicotiana tomentosiformis]XP_033510814.1 uncharacterized protein At2g27730, mitochondrial-like [Nicotiana tomentosiformis]